MKRLLALALASLLSAAPATVLGLGLGEIRLHSALNQNLDAEIELLDVSADEVDGLVVRLAGAELFERYGIDRVALLNDLTFEVVRRSDGSAFVRLRSTQPVREPFLTLLVEARWGRGRLLREYTMLVDPPAFAEVAPEPVVAAEAVSEPTYAPTVETPAAPVAAPVETDTAVAAPESAPEYSAPEAAAPQVAAPSTPAYTGQPSATTPEPLAGGGDYGPVKRNETLWAIASRLKADDAITVNQMMIAIFRANPEAFRGNINRLNAGAILRIPDLASVRDLSAQEAFQEAKRQHEAWRPGFAATPALQPEPSVEQTAPSPEPAPVPEPRAETPVAPTPEPVAPAPADPQLSVVAPSDEDAAESDPGARVAQLERELAEARAAGGKGKKARDRIAKLEEELTQARRLVQVESDTLAAVQDQAAAVPSQAEAPAATAPAETAPTEAAPAERPVQRAPRKAEKGLVDKVLDNLTDPLVLGGLVALILVVLGLVAFKRLKPRLAALAAARKARAEQAAAAKVAADWAETSGEDDRTIAAGTPDSESATALDVARPASGGAADGGIAGLFGGGGDGRTGETMVELDVPAAVQEAAAEKTQFMPRPEAEMEKTVMQTVAAPQPAPAPAAAPKAGGHEDTVIGGTPMKLDENDPLSEADFHMAYGLYDQAADLLKKAAQRDPSRRDIKLKLLETYFASGNKGAFVEAARALRAEMGAKPDADWNSVLIFGKQMAPEEALFSEQASAAAADLDFGAAGGTETAIDLAFDAPAEAPAAAADSLDFDITGAGGAPVAPVAAEPAPAPAAPAADAGGLEFDLGDFKLDTEAATEAPAAKAAPAVGTGEVKDTDTQSDFDKALAELSAFVDTNLPAEEAGGAVEAGGEFNLDSLDLGDDAALGDVELDAGDAGDEIDTKLDLARAYIDMGDPDGARNILDEVANDGNATQKAEAQKLLAQIK